ncbi:trehalose import ATP-binding protein SugC [bacterium BMS3Bbin02]|nr:trehalose import ATP-binding protein SugC [bacterium BMS3Bbin02]
MTAVSLRHISRRFGEHLAVRDLNLDIDSGELVAFLGPSGCGKTTTLRMITGLIEPTSGDVLFDGESVLSTPTERRGAVMVFQKHLLFPTMNVAQNVGFGLKMAKVSKDEAAQRVEDILDLVDLPGLEHRKAHELSGGQQQRVALARALVVRPKVLLLDEPLANLDANLRITMRHLIRSIQKELGITAIFVTHDQEEAVMLADRVALMFDGVLQQVGAPDEFFRAPRTTGIARFFRNGNFLRGRRQGSIVRTDVGDIEIAPGSTNGRDGPTVLTVRPEEVQLVTKDTPQDNVVPAVVTSLIYMGSHSQLTVTIGDTPWQIHAPAAFRASNGDTIQIRLPRDHVSIVSDDDDTVAEQSGAAPPNQTTIA